jgi:hypothetical protein
MYKCMLYSILWVLCLWLCAYFAYSFYFFLFYFFFRSPDSNIPTVIIVIQTHLSSCDKWKMNNEKWKIRIKCILLTKIIVGLECHMCKVISKWLLKQRSWTVNNFTTTWKVSLYKERVVAVRWVYILLLCALLTTMGNNVHVTSNRVAICLFYLKTNPCRMKCVNNNFFLFIPCILSAIPLLMLWFRETNKIRRRW